MTINRLPMSLALVLGAFSSALFATTLDFNGKHKELAQYYKPFSQKVMTPFSPEDKRALSTLSGKDSLGNTMTRSYAISLLRDKDNQKSFAIDLLSRKCNFDTFSDSVRMHKTNQLNIKYDVRCFNGTERLTPQNIAGLHYVISQFKLEEQVSFELDFTVHFETKGFGTAWIAL